jgi:hypothetical protein
MATAGGETSGGGSESDERSRVGASTRGVASKNRSLKLDHDRRRRRRVRFENGGSVERAVAATKAAQGG